MKGAVNLEGLFSLEKKTNKKKPQEKQTLCLQYPTGNKQLFQEKK